MQPQGKNRPLAGTTNILPPGFFRAGDFYPNVA